MEVTVEKTGLLRGKKHLFTFADYKGALALDREGPEKIHDRNFHRVR